MILNWLVYPPYWKKKIILTKKVIDQSAYYHTCQKSLKKCFHALLLYRWKNSAFYWKRPKADKKKSEIGSKDLPHKIMLNNNEITSSNEEKQLGLLLDSKLNFESHIGLLCGKASQKINALARLKNYLIKIN